MGRHLMKHLLTLENLSDLSRDIFGLSTVIGLKFVGKNFVPVMKESILSKLSELSTIYNLKDTISTRGASQITFLNLEGSYEYSDLLPYFKDFIYETREDYPSLDGYIGICHLFIMDKNNMNADEEYDTTNIRFTIKGISPTEFEYTTRFGKVIERKNWDQKTMEMLYARWERYN